MKYSVFIDSEREEEVLIYAKSRHSLIERLEELLSESDEALIGYRGEEIVRLDTRDVECFTVEDGRVYAITDKAKYQLKTRLYQAEERFGRDFVRINQSCLVRVCAVDRFTTSIGGALCVVMKSGYRDYVSRRQLKEVKERIGF